MLAAMLAMLATLVPAGGGAAAASSSSSSSEPLDDAEISRATEDFYRTWPYPLSTRGEEATNESLAEGFDVLFDLGSTVQINHFAFGSRRNWNTGVFRVLVAGSGTGKAVESVIA